MIGTLPTAGPGLSPVSPQCGTLPRQGHATRQLPVPSIAGQPKPRVGQCPRSTWTSRCCSTMSYTAAPELSKVSVRIGPSGFSLRYGLPAQTSSPLWRSAGRSSTSRPRGWLIALAHGSCLRAIALVHAGQIRAAEADARLAFDFKLANSPPQALVWALFPLVKALTEFDDADAAPAAAQRRGDPPPDGLAAPLLLEPAAFQSQSRKASGANGQPRMNVVHCHTWPSGSSGTARQPTTSVPVPCDTPTLSTSSRIGPSRPSTIQTGSSMNPIPCQPMPTACASSATHPARPW